MKPILRDCQTGLFFRGGAAWTRNPAEALVYNDIEGALEAAHSSSIASLELNLLLFDDPRYTVRLALDKFLWWPRRERRWSLSVISLGGFRKGSSIGMDFD